MEKGRLNREIWGVVICLTALLIIISLLTYRPSDRSFNTPSGAIDTNNWGGFVGAYLADLFSKDLESPHIFYRYSFVSLPFKCSAQTTHEFPTVKSSAMRFFSSAQRSFCACSSSLRTPVKPAESWAVF